MNGRGALTNGCPSLNQYDGLGARGRSLTDFFPRWQRSGGRVFAPFLQDTREGTDQLISAPVPSKRCRLPRLPTPPITHPQFQTTLLFLVYLIRFIVPRIFFYVLCCLMWDGKKVLLIVLIALALCIRDTYFKCSLLHAITSNVVLYVNVIFECLL